MVLSAANHVGRWILIQFLLLLVTFVKLMSLGPLRVLEVKSRHYLISDQSHVRPQVCLDNTLLLPLGSEHELSIKGLAS